MNGVLTKRDILKLIQQKPSLIEGYVDLEAQLQPNGLDITLRDVALIEDAGQIAVSDKDRKISKTSMLKFDEAGFIDLKPGPYLVTFNEIVSLPKNIMALARPRSSLLRCGVTIGTAVWDAGYSGRSQSTLLVHNSHGFRLQKNARILQLVFFTLSDETEGYNGAYQRENIA